MNKKSLPKHALLALQACAVLKGAYKAAQERGGSVDWCLVDDAYVAASKAIASEKAYHRAAARRTAKKSNARPTKPSHAHAALAA